MNNLYTDTQNNELFQIMESIKNRPEIEEVELLAQGKIILPGSSSITGGSCCPDITPF